MNLIMLLILLGVLAVLAAPFVAGKLIMNSRQRSMAGIYAELAEHRPAETFLPRVPIAAIAAEPADPIDRFEFRMTKKLRGCADAIGAALDVFAEQAKAHYGDGYDQPRRLEGRPVQAWAARDIALLRMRAGVYEPLSAYRPGTTETAWQDMTALRALFAAEDALALG